MPFPEDLDPLLRPWLDEHTPTASDFAQAQKRAARVLSALQRDPDAGVLESGLGGSVLKDTAILPISDLDVIVYMDGDEWSDVSGGWERPEELLGWLTGRISKTLKWHQGHNYLDVNTRRRSVEIRYTNEDAVKIDVVPILLADGNKEHGWIPDPGLPRGYRSTSIERQLRLINRYARPHRPLRDAVRLLKRWKMGQEIPLISYALEVLAMHTRATRGLSTPAEIMWGVLDGVAEGLLLDGVHLPDYFAAPRCADAARVFDPADRHNNLTKSLDEEDAEEIAKRARFTLGKLRRALRFQSSADEIIAEAFGEVD